MVGEMDGDALLQSNKYEVTGMLLFAVLVWKLEGLVCYTFVLILEVTLF